MKVVKGVKKLQRFSRTPFGRARSNLAWLGVWPTDTCSPNFMNFGRGFRDTMQSRGSVIH